MAKAQMNQSWYDTHMKMMRKHNEIFLDKQTPIATDDENDTDDITRLMGMLDVPDLRDRLFASQQELCAYHTMLDEMEEIEAANKQLESEAAERLEERSLHKQTLKKDAYNAVESLENEIVGLKMELAQSREKEDSHVARMQSVLNEMKSLEEEVKALRETADIQPITNKRIRASTGGLFQICCENDAQAAEKSSFLSSFNRGAVHAIRQRLDDERIHAKRSHSFTAMSA